MNQQLKITLCAVGDLMLGDHPVVFGHGVRSRLGKEGKRWLFSKAHKAWEGADIVFGNLESVLSNTGMVTGDLKSSEMRGRPETVHSLAEAGFNILNVANNHILQHGEAAFSETIDLLKQNGIASVGLRSVDGRFYSQPCHVERKGITVGFLGYSFQKEKHTKKPPLYAVAQEDKINADVQ